MERIKKEWEGGKGKVRWYFVIFITIQCDKPGKPRERGTRITILVTPSGLQGVAAPQDMP